MSDDAMLLKVEVDPPSRVNNDGSRSALLVFQISLNCSLCVDLSICVFIWLLHVKLVVSRFTEIVSAFYDL